MVNEPGVYDHLTELQHLLDGIQTYQQNHAELVSNNPTVDAYWHAGSQIVAAALQIRSAMEMVRQGNSVVG